VSAAATVLAVAAALIIALAVGWNDPRPAHRPAWRSADLPTDLEVPADGVVLQLTDWSADEFSLEIETRSLNRTGISEAGLVFGARDANHYTLFATGTDGYYAVVRANGTEVETLIPWQEFPHIRLAGQPNRLRVSCCRSTCEFFVNDERATSIEYPARQPGQIGLWAAADNTSTIVAFDEMQAWRGCD